MEAPTVSVLVKYYHFLQLRSHSCVMKLVCKGFQSTLIHPQKSKSANVALHTTKALLN